jgi:thiamine biosynthesis lipoprotein
LISAERFAVAAMGTRFELCLAAGERNLRAAGEAALDEIEGWHRRLSRFAPDSLVSHINRTAFERPVRLDRETFALFADALAVWRATDGAFDIAVAPRMAAQGFAPSSVAGDERASGCDAIVLDENAWTIGFSRPGVSIDLGAIAKGHAVDAAAAVLRTGGVTSAIVHGGTSSVAAIGAPPGDEGWRVAIGGDGGRRVLTIADACLGVSDPFSQAGPERGAHIIDPRTGRAVTRPARVAVLGPSARLADAWSTALVVFGSVPGSFPEAFQAFIDVEEGS